MSDSLIHLEIVTPGRIVFNGEVKSFTAPGIEGSFQVLHNHAPFISTIIPGPVKFTAAGGGVKNFVTSGGTVEVHGNSITMLAETIIPVEEIDVKQAESDKSDAERILQSSEHGLDKDSARHKLLVAKAMIKAVSA